ncbi:MAG: AAA family ATPase, partial [Eubacteriales bacterium]|nr:AAA family ATPase [Eubacteriales bacterium]
MTVRNIALIESVELEFHTGLHVLTGETGAGKSIVVDSINLLLGERADRGLIRNGCEKATVEGMFDLTDCPQARELLAQQQLEMDGCLMPVLREISTTDRNLCRVCGVIVPLSFLRQLSALLVDVHGQHEHQSLLDEKNHLGFLDAFGEEPHRRLMAETRERYLAWRESSTRFSALRKQNAQRQDRLEFITSRLKELEAAKLKRGEEAALEQERARLSGAEKINRALETAYAAASSSDGRRSAAMELLDQATNAMRQIAEYDPRYQALSERLHSAYYEVEEAAIELRGLLESAAFDPERSERIAERLDLYRRLERRYGRGGDELAKYAEELRAELGELHGMDDRLRSAEGEFKARLTEYRKAASALTQSRAAVADRLHRLMERQLGELGMGSTHFECVFEQAPPDQKRVPSETG